MNPSSSTAPGGEPPAGAEFIRQFLPTSPFVKHLGMQLVEMRPEATTLTLPYVPEVATLGNTVHGGAIASLIDTAAMVAAWSGAEAPANMRGTTVGMTVSYLAPANGEDVRAEARVLRRGRSLVYVDVEVRVASGELVAKGLVTYKLG